MQRCFDIALSFVGRDEWIAQQLAQCLMSQGYHVFIHGSYSSILQGHELRRVLPIIYCRMSRAFVAISSRIYASASNSSLWEDMSLTAVHDEDGQWRRAIHWAGLEWEVAYSTYCREHKSVTKRWDERPLPFVYRGKVYPGRYGSPFLAPDHLIVVTTDGSLPIDCNDDIIAPLLTESTISEVASYISERVGPPIDVVSPSRIAATLNSCVQTIGNQLDDPEELLPLHHSRLRLRAHSQAWAPLIESRFRRVARRVYGDEFSLVGHRRWIFWGPTFDERPGADFEISMRYPYWTVVLQDQASLGRRPTGTSSPEHLQALSIEADEGFYWFMTGGARYPMSAFGLMQAMERVEAAGSFRNLAIEPASDPRLGMLKTSPDSSWWKLPVAIVHRACSRVLETGDSRGV